MNKRLLILIAMTLLMFLAVVPCAMARMFLYGPQDMVERAAFIVDATVVESKAEKNEHGDKQPVGRFKVNAILKGSEMGAYFTVGSDQGGMPGMYTQRIPEPGTQVLIFLEKGPSQFAKTDFHFICDDNNIAVIKDGAIVDVYEGTNVETGSYTPAYNSFYQEKMKKHLAEIQRIKERRAQLKRIEEQKLEAAKERRQAKQRNALVAISIAAALAGASLGLLWSRRTRT